MKSLAILIFALLSFNSIAQTPPPVSLRGMGNTAKLLPKWNLQVPAQQATNLGGIDALIETGNWNQLINASFQGALGSGWVKTDTGGTATLQVNTNVKMQGMKQSYRINMTGWTGKICNQIVMGPDFPSQQIGSMHVLNVGTHVGGQVCIEADGVEQACRSVTTNTTYERFVEYAIPAVAGTNFLSVCYKQATAGTGFAYLGAAFLGPMASNLTPAVASVTPWTSGTCTSSHTTNTITTCKYRQVGENLEVQARNTYSGAPQNVTLMFSLPTGFTVDSNKLINSISDVQNIGNAAFHDNGVALYSGFVKYRDASNVVVYDLVANSTYVFESTTGNTTPIVAGNTDSVNITYSVPVFANSTWTTYSADADSKAKAGEVFAFAGAACPAGSIEADGGSRSKATEAELFSVLGTISGDGSTAATGAISSAGCPSVSGCFNVPDYRGRFLRGHTGLIATDADSATRTAQATGGNAGNLVGSVQEDANKSHIHPTYIPNQSYTAAVGGSAIRSMGTATNSNIVTRNSDGGMIGYEGATDARPKNTYVKYCIRVSSSMITATFQGVPRVPGGSVIEEWAFDFSGEGTNGSCVTNGPCTLDQIGTAVASVTRTGTGLYTILFGKTYKKISCQSSGYFTSPTTMDPMWCTNCNGFTSWPNRVKDNAATSDGKVNVNCIGTL